MSGTDELFQNQETIPKQVFAVASFGTQVRKLGNCELKLVARLATVTEFAVVTSIMDPRWRNSQTCRPSLRSSPVAILKNVRDDLARLLTFLGAKATTKTSISRPPPSSSRTRRCGDSPSMVLEDMAGLMEWHA